MGITDFIDVDAKDGEFVVDLDVPTITKETAIPIKKDTTPFKIVAELRPQDACKTYILICPCHVFLC